MKQEISQLYQYLCPCGNKVKATGLNTVVQCSCGKTMYRTNDLKGLRMARGLRQNVVAERLGITNTYLSKIEKGSVPCPQIIAKKLKDLYTEKLNQVKTG